MLLAIGMIGTAETMNLGIRWVGGFTPEMYPNQYYPCKL